MIHLLRKIHQLRLKNSKHTTTWYYPDGTPFTFKGRVVERNGVKMVKP